MAKRFTDDLKWQDPWFRKLTPNAKVFWLFLLDCVDVSGVWDRDDSLFQFLSGCPLEVDSHLEELEGRILTLPDGKILVPKFVKFQQGAKLSPKSPSHLQVLRLFEKHDLEQDASGLVVMSKGQARGKPGVTKGLTKGLARGKEGAAKPHRYSIVESSLVNIKEGGMGETIPESLDVPEFHAAWESFLVHRSQNKWGKFKAGTIKAKFKEFEEWGLEETVKALNVSVKQGWRGVFLQSEKKQEEDDDRDYANAADF